MSSLIEWGRGGVDTEAKDWKPLERFPVEFSIGDWDIVLNSSKSGGMITVVCIPQNGGINDKRTISYRPSELPEFNKWLDETGAKNHPIFRFIEPIAEKHF